MKTKQQKQIEALERKRKFFHIYIENWIKSHPGSEEYKNLVSKHGVKYAEDCQGNAERALVKAAAEAHVDRYGNPL